MDREPAEDPTPCVHGKNSLDSMGTSSCKEGGAGSGPGGMRGSLWGGEYDQNTLYAYVKFSRNQNKYIVKRHLMNEYMEGT